MMSYDKFLDLAPTLSLLFFFTIFVGIAIWALRPALKEKLQMLADIPLKEDV